VILIGNVLAAIFAGTAQAGPMTLDDAVAIAARNAFSIQIQSSNVEKLRQREAQARAQLGPKVTIDGTYTRNDKAVSTNFGGTTFVQQPIDSKSVSATLTMPIDISGNLNRNVKAAQKQILAGRETLAADMNDARLNARAAYFNVLRNENLVVVAQENLKDAQERNSQAEKLFAQDQVARVDLQRFGTLVAQANSDLIAATNALDLARNQFNFVLARPIETPVELADVAVPPPVADTPDDLVRLGQAQRPEARSLEYSAEGLALTRRALEAGMNPSLNALIQHQRAIDNQIAGSNDTTTFGRLTLDIPVFDMGLTRARVKEARQDELQAKINLDQLRLSISQEVRDAVKNLEGAAARMKNADEQVKLAEEVYRLSTIKQSNGVGTYVEIIDAEAALTQARTNAVTARYDYLTAYAQLQRAVGSDNLKAVPSEGK
jgi:outer membrane protein TolC